MPPSITGEAAHSGDNDDYNERGDYDSHYENVPFKATHSSSTPTSSAKERLNNESHFFPTNPASHRHSVRGAARVSRPRTSLPEQRKITELAELTAIHYELLAATSHDQTALLIMRNNETLP